MNISGLIAHVSVGGKWMGKSYCVPSTFLRTIAIDLIICRWQMDGGVLLPWWMSVEEQLLPWEDHAGSFLWWACHAKTDYVEKRSVATKTWQSWLHQCKYAKAKVEIGEVRFYQPKPKRSNILPTFRLSTLSDRCTRKCPSLLITLRKGQDFCSQRLISPWEFLGQRASDGWVWHLLWRRKTKTNRQAKLISFQDHSVELA